MLVPKLPVLPDDVLTVIIELTDKPEVCVDDNYSIANKTTLKGYFEIGDIPSQAQYADLIDSNLNLQETGTQILVGTLSASFLEVQNHITSSGNISASGYLVVQNITASGNIVQVAQ